MPNQLDLEEQRAFAAREYPPEKAKRILYELEYYNLHGELPPDAIVIEKIEWFGDSSLIIHQDPDALRQ